MLDHLNWIVPGILLVMAAILPMLLTYIINKVVNKKLYDERGLPIFVAIGECSKAQGRCTRTMCLKMEEVKAIIEELKNDIRRNGALFTDMVENIKQTLHEHDLKREAAREDYFKLGSKLVALETKTTILAQEAKEIKHANQAKP